MVKVLLFFLIIYIIFKAGRFFGQVESKIKSAKDDISSKNQDINNPSDSKPKKNSNKEKLEEAEYKDLE